jgi:hypothetical protein
MAVGCQKLGIYRTPGSTNQRGYCFTHKHFAVPPPAPVESGVEYLARQFEALEARGDAWAAEVDDDAEV